MAEQFPPQLALESFLSFVFVDNSNIKNDSV